MKSIEGILIIGVINVIIILNKIIPWGVLDLSKLYPAGENL